MASRIPGVKEMNDSNLKISDEVWKLIDWITDVRNIEIKQSPTASKVYRNVLV